MKMDLKIQIKAFAITVGFFLLIALIVLVVCWMILGFFYLIDVGIITPLTLSCIFSVIILIYAFVRVYREIYKQLKDKEELKD